MKIAAVTLGSLAFASAVNGVGDSPDCHSNSYSWVTDSERVLRRALPNAPDGYTPSKVQCPATRPSARSAVALSHNETSWLPIRRNKTLAAMKDFFGHVKIANFDAVSYLEHVASRNSSNLPNIGIAMSGGGYRALLTGAGALKAFDNRTDNSTARGELGGLLQSATYVAGSSGGSWLVGSMFVNNFSTISALETIKPGMVWQFGNSVLEGPDTGGSQLLDSADYYLQIQQAVSGKENAGFKTTITDYWGRALSYQLVNATDGGPQYTWSSIALMPQFQAAEYPMPLVVADGRYPNEVIVSSNATIYEFNPWEFGSWDPTIFGFVPLEFLGSRFIGGRLPSNESCIRGYDNVGFVMGTSSTIFNNFFLYSNSSAFPSFLQSALSSILKDLGKTNLDIAEYYPNPFYHYHNHSSPYANRPFLDLVDGGEDNQNIPFHPLIRPNRHIDVVFAIDSSADTRQNWPNGSSVVATYERSLNKSGVANGTAFPSIPDVNTFINLGLNTRPTFFGCNSSNITGSAPLIVYIPNFPYVTYSNTSTFKDTYNDTQRDVMILNGYDVVTMANSSRDGNWTACVGCAILSRSFDRTNTSLPSICKQCFHRYCWNGNLNSTHPGPYEPTTALPPVSLSSVAAALVPTLCMSLIAGSFGLFLSGQLW